MNRAKLIGGLSVCASAIAVAGAHDASACGGCFHPPTQTVSDITDERMLLAVSTQQSTLYDQLRYSGSPSNFAWVLPIHGTVDIGLSADVLFDSIDVLTETQINPPAPNCPSPNCFFAANAAASSGSAASGGLAAPAVTVLKQENVGPYATVQLHATDSSALDNWLAQNGYNVPADVAPVIAEYVAEGFDFLAMKLLPNQGVQAMRPVRVTTPGASLSLPLRMAAVGTGASIGITIWVVADGRYEPQNFPFFHIDDSALVWDFAMSESNYTTLRVQNEANLMGKGWEIESSISLNEQTITNVILSGGQYYGGGGFGGPIAAPSDPSLDYLPAGDPDAGAEAGVTQTAEEVRTADVNALFAGITGPNVRVTRIRTDILHTAMTADFVLQASADQSELSNVRNVTQSVNLTCPLYNGCQVVGTGTPAQAAASIAAGSGQSGSFASGSTSASGSSGSLASGSTSASGSFSGSPDQAGAASGAGQSPGGGGCAASAASSGGSAGALGAIAGMLGLIAGRMLRARRQRRES
jgi:Uncharacterized protein conserved in bacteria (DUF2330)